jgi:pSer/pThr/pTyr-binding forkhead associated (FHA) protein
MQTDITDPVIKELNTRASNTFGYNTLEYTKYEQTKTNPNINISSNNNNIDTKNEEKNEIVTRAEKKKITIAEFHQIKIPTNKKDNLFMDPKNNAIFYTHSNNTKVTGNTIANTNSSNSHIKKDLFSVNNENNINNNFKYTSLDLEVINSWNLPKGLKLHINKDHLDNSLRNENDGKIYFGFQKDINISNEKPYIDYLLLPKDNDYDNKFIGIHFQIRYDEKNNKYYIKDLGSGYGTFIKLIEPLKIKNNLLINIGDTFIVFSFKENDEKNENIILKIFTGNEQSEIFEFNSEKKIIIFGRETSCDVHIEDKLLSRKHCYIYYNENENNNEESNCWYIKDGDLTGKKSTNDTWLYALEDTLIYDQMIFNVLIIIIFYFFLILI